MNFFYLLFLIFIVSTVSGQTTYEFIIKKVPLSVIELGSNSTFVLIEDIGANESQQGKGVYKIEKDTLYLFFSNNPLSDSIKIYKRAKKNNSDSCKVNLKFSNGRYYSNIIDTTLLVSKNGEILKSFYGVNMESVFEAYIPKDDTFQIQMNCVYTYTNTTFSFLSEYISCDSDIDIKVFYNQPCNTFFGPEQYWACENIHQLIDTILKYPIVVNPDSSIEIEVCNPSGLLKDFKQVLIKSEENSFWSEEW